MAFFSSSLITKRLQPPRKYDTFESLVIESKFGNYDVTLLGLYRPPKAVSGEYAAKPENDLHDILAWATLQTNFVVITGDLDLDRLKPHLREGKVLCDVEDVYGLSSNQTNKNYREESNFTGRYLNQQTGTVQGSRGV